MAKLYVVGIGPGGRENMTLKAIETIKSCEVIVGYEPYIEYVRDLVEGKEIVANGMRKEIERCQKAIDMVKSGKNTAIISTGDAGLYGMAGPIFELAEDIEVEVVPGVTASFSAASELGAPIMHDNATISLSDLLTPWSVILNRLEMAAKGDFVISIYNPRSKGRKDHLEQAINIIRKYRNEETPVGIVKNSGRDKREIRLTNLKDMDFEIVDMLSIVIIGNTNTFIKNGKMLTPRGYEIK